MSDQGTTGLVIDPRFRRGGPGQRGSTTAEDSGYELMELMRNRVGLADYAESSILDIGCGTRILEAIVGRNVAVRRYVGMDVDGELIEHLSSQVEDSRFAFSHLNVHNKLYNAEGESLTVDFTLPVQEKFDVICLFSVFTHLDPGDTDCMLSVLKRYMRETGKLIFTCFIDDSVSGFDDQEPSQPLLRAAYSERVMRHFITRNGWTIDALHPPTKSNDGYWLMQHCFVCHLLETP